MKAVLQASLAALFALSLIESAQAQGQFVCDSSPTGPTDPLGQTTETLTILPGQQPLYRSLVPCGGWVRQVRTDLAKAPPPGTRTPLLSLIHLSDIHIIDAESPMRIEFLRHQRGLILPEAEFQAAFRPQETMTAQVTEAMIRQLNAIGKGPVSGRAFDLAVTTGDSGDGHQLNELLRMVDLLNGGNTIEPATGDDYAGVQDNTPSPVFAQYWHPDPTTPSGHECTPVIDHDHGMCERSIQPGQNKWQICYCFPAYPGLLEQAMGPFTATGLKWPWIATYGNHDRLLQGNFALNDKQYSTPELSKIAVGDSKLLELPKQFRSDNRFWQMVQVDAFLAEFLNPLESDLDMRHFARRWASGPQRPVTPDPTRQLWKVTEFVDALLNAPGPHGPPGHGFDDGNRDSGNLYYAVDLAPGGPIPLLGLVLDTTNPGGLSGGSLDNTQFNWLEAQLIAASPVYYNAAGQKKANPGASNALVILFSHHNSQTLDNVFPYEGPLAHLTDRKRIADFEKLMHRFPNAVLWLNGHTHYPRVFAHADPSGKTPGFWEINTPSLIDFPQMARLVELVDNGNGTLSIFGTLVDHAGPADPAEAKDILRLAAISRQLAANDPLLNMSNQVGTPGDRNVELLLRSPLDAP